MAYPWVSLILNRFTLPYLTLINGMIGGRPGGNLGDNAKKGKKVDK